MRDLHLTLSLPSPGGVRQIAVVEASHGNRVAVVVLAPAAPAGGALQVVAHCQDIRPTGDPDVRAGERLDHA